MCMKPPKMPAPPPPLPPPPAPLAPPPASATAATVTQQSAAPATPTRQRVKNPLRTDQGGTDSVASGLNIPV
jgi:hypothetical protein